MREKVGTHSHKNEVCPKCKCSWTLSSYWVVQLSLDNWVFAAVAFIAVFWIGSSIQALPALKISAASIAVVPILVTLFKKSACSDCDIEFDSEKPE